jgi:hypothetical protein
MADLAAVQQDLATDEEGVVVPILKKTFDPYLGADGKESTITVLGSDSKAYRRAMEANQRRAIKLAGRVTPADLDQNRIDQAAAACIAWSGWEVNGQPWAFSSENVKKLLEVRHILNQVEAAIEGHGRFFASSSPS